MFTSDGHDDFLFSKASCCWASLEQCYKNQLVCFSCLDLLKEFLRGIKFSIDHVVKNTVSKIVDFAVPADQRVKLKENERKHKYLDLVRELNNCGT